MRRPTRSHVLATLTLILLSTGISVASTRTGVPRSRSKTTSAPNVHLTIPDTMKISIGEVRNPVPISLPTVSTQAKRNWFDWLGLLGALLIAPIAALLAAQLGARIGGREARKAAIEIQQREAMEARRLREEERRETERRECSLLLRMFEKDLVLLGGVADAVAVTHQIGPVMPATAMRLRAMWDAHFRHRGAAVLLSDPDLEHEIEFFYDRMLSMEGWFEKYLKAEADDLGMGNPNPEKIQRRAEVAEQTVREHIARAREILPRLVVRVEDRNRL